MRNSLWRASALGVVAAVLLTLGISAPAGAQTPADDVQQVVENLPAAAEALADGLQAAADTAAETQSAVETSAAVGQALVDSGSALVAGTEQFGALGLGLTLVNFATQAAIDDYLGVIDGTHDPAELLTAEDIETIADNAGPASDIVTDNATQAVIEALRGNLVAPGLLDPATGTPSALGNALAIVSDFQSGGVAYVLTEGSNLQEEGSALPLIGLVVGGAAGGAAGEQLVELEESLAPLFEAAEPATGELIALLEGV